MLCRRFLEAAMYKILGVALLAACMVNMGCLLSHLAGFAG